MVSTAPEQARDIPRFLLEVAGVPHNTIVRNLSPGVISGLINLEGGTTLSLECARYAKIGSVFLTVSHNTTLSIIRG